MDPQNAKLLALVIMAVSAVIIALVMTKDEGKNRPRTKE